MTKDGRVKDGVARLWDRERLADPHGQLDKAHRVRGMFDAIAGTYELVNALGSLGLDRYWRRVAVSLARMRTGERILDVACGTGDLARAFAAGACRPKTIVGLDFAGEMLLLASQRPGRIRWCRGDALRLPFGAGVFSVVSCAFGVRNFQDVEAGFRQMYEVLEPGGRSVILEFSMPTRPVVRWLYRFYFEHLMPVAATILSRDRAGAYRYLPQSVVSFYGRDELVAMLRRAGFGRVDVRALSMGAVVVYVAWKASDG
jgi:demethylmenaquinone methyltransferase/2-methoxy-6-polyprenyl-1,4-benzoquinol methylase